MPLTALLLSLQFQSFDSLRVSVLPNQHDADWLSFSGVAPRFLMISGYSSDEALMYSVRVYVIFALSRGGTSHPRCALLLTALLIVSIADASGDHGSDLTSLHRSKVDRRGPNFQDR